jgi:hypothetical protein
MTECDFRRLDHPVYSLDLAPCDFSLFDYLHKKMVGSMYEKVDELEEKIRVIIKAIAKSRLIAILREYQMRMDECIENKADYFE